MKLIATTIEQSKRLLAVGYHYSSPLHWVRHQDGTEYLCPYSASERMHMGDPFDAVYPAWDLGTLWDSIHKDFRECICKPELSAEELIESFVSFIEETWIR